MRAQMMDDLQRAAIKSVKNLGYEVETRTGRGSLITIKKNGIESVVAVRLTASSRVGASLNENEEWRVLPSTDFVLIAAADGLDGVLDYTVETCSVWLVETEEVIRRLEILKADRSARGYDLKKQGYFLSLHMISNGHRQSPGSGLGEEIEPIARGQQLNGNAAHSVDPSVCPLSIEEAKVAVAAKLGVSKDQVRILVEY